MSYGEAIPVVNVAGNNGGAFGGDGWWTIIIFALIFGWGRGGYGGGCDSGGGSSGAAAGYVLATDFANIERKIDGVNNGLSDGFYAMNTGMLNGFANVTQAVTNGFYNAEIARCNQQSALMNQLNEMQRASDACCCENRAAIAQVRYDMATQACDTRNLIQNNTRDLIDAVNCGFRGIDQRLTMQEMAAKDAKIAEQDRALLLSQFAAQRNAQTDEFKSYVNGQFAYYNPRPVPAYNVPAPYQYTCNTNSCSGCGC